jgi:Tfp pilus assembly pilus retraction ATPase PilT
MTIIESAEAASIDFDAIFLSTGTSPFLRTPGKGAAIPIDAIRQITNQDVLAAYQEFQSDTNIKVLTAARKTDRRGALAVSIRGKGRYRIDWYHQRSSLSMTIRRVPFDRGPWVDLWAPDYLTAAYKERIEPLLMPGKVVWITSDTPQLGHLFADALAEECSHAHSCAKIVKVDDPVRYLHKSSADCLIEQIEVGVDCESISEAVRAVSVSAADGAIIDVSWADASAAQSGIDNLRDEGLWVVAWAPLRYADPNDCRIIVNRSTIEVLA